MYLTSPPSYPPSLGAGLLSALLHHPPPARRNPFVFSVGRLVSRRCHIIDSIAQVSSDLRYYEGSDSCRTSPVRQASPFHLSCLPSIQPPTTLRACTSRFLITPVRTIGSLRFQASPHIQQARRYAPPKRVRYPAGCSFALQLLSTPSRMTRYHPTLGDAVAFGYMYGDFTWHRLTLC